MTPEEKAKAYDEALELMKDCIPDEDGLVHVRPEEIFYELKESEDERIRKWIKNELESKYVVDNIVNNVMADKALAWLERQCEKGINGNDREIPFSEQILANSAKTCKDAWSEEDERIYNLLYEEYKNLAYYSHSRNQARDIPGEVLGWLKSLKERVQPKQEWSEEDENIRNEVIKYFKSLLECLSTEKRYAENRKWINWLESLRPQNWTKEDKERYISCLQRLSTGNPEQPETINSKWFKEHVYSQPTWKPSDEQIEALEHFVRGVGESGYASPYDDNTKLLYSLLEDLKKLKD